MPQTHGYRHSETPMQIADALGIGRADLVARRAETRGLSRVERRKRLDCVLLKAVTAQDVREIAACLLKQAKNPDSPRSIQAATLIFERAIGAVDQNITVDVRAIVGNLSDEQLIAALQRSSGNSVVEIEVENVKVLGEENPKSESQGNPCDNSQALPAAQIAPETSGTDAK